jgi:hypothetical protein
MYSKICSTNALSRCHPLLLIVKRTSASSASPITSRLTTLFLDFTWFTDCSWFFVSARKASQTLKMTLLVVTKEMVIGYWNFRNYFRVWNKWGANGFTRLYWLRSEDDFWKGVNDTSILDDRAQYYIRAGYHPGRLSHQITHISLPSFLQSFLPTQTIITPQLFLTVTNYCFHHISFIHCCVVNSLLLEKSSEQIR